MVSAIRKYFHLETRKLLWTLDMGDTNWDHRDQLIDQIKTQMTRARFKKGKLNLSDINWCFD